MANATELLRQGKKDEIWKKYCGFIDLGVKEFMEIQENLLSEQIERLGRCELGRKIIGGVVPKSVEEFREKVPLTTYRDYGDYLLERREDVLPEKPYAWAHTSGRSGEYQFKWIPYTKKMFDIAGEAVLSDLILASCKGRGDIALEEGDTSLCTVAPPPYLSGVLIESLLNAFHFRVLPPTQKALKLDFQKRIEEGFKDALEEGLDFFYGISSILLRVSDQFSQGGRGGGRNLSGLRKPKILLRLLKAFLKSRLAGRELLPKDVWKVKGILCGGTDTSIFKDRVTKSWGRTPLEAYGATEFGPIASQVWTYEGMTFVPNNNFWEFIPEEDYHRMVSDRDYTPRVLLLSEVEPNKEYVLVGTNFHGGALVRYILGDLIKIVSLEDKKAGIKLPQMTFSTRIDDIIDVAGFTRLTEKTIWQAIENSGVGYVEWTVKKEYLEGKPVLNLYIEMTDESHDTSSIGKKIHECLKDLNEPYKELEEMAGLKPLKVTALSKGTFRRYFEERQAAGLDLAHLKPAHVNPPDSAIENLLRMSSWKI